MPVLSQKWSTRWDVPGESYQAVACTPDAKALVSCNWTRIRKSNLGSDTDREVTIEIERHNSKIPEIRIVFYLKDNFDSDYKIFPENTRTLLKKHWIALLAEMLTELLKHVENYDSRVEITLSTEKPQKKYEYKSNFVGKVSHTISIVPEAVNLIKPGEIGLTAAILSTLANRIIYPSGKALIQDARKMGLDDITTENYEKSVEMASKNSRWQEPLYVLKPFYSLMRICGSLIIHPSTPVLGFMSRFDRNNKNINVILSDTDAAYTVRPMSLRHLELTRKIVNHNPGMALLGNSLLGSETRKTLTGILSEEVPKLSTGLLSKSAVRVCQEALMMTTPDEALSIPSVLAMRTVIRSLAASMNSESEWEHLRSEFLNDTNRIMHPVQGVSSVCLQMRIVESYITDILALANLLDNHLEISSDDMSILSLTKKQFLTGHVFKKVNKTMQLYHTGVIKTELRPYASLRDSMRSLNHDVIKPLVVSLCTVVGIEPDQNMSAPSMEECCSIMIPLVKTLSAVEQNTQ